MEGRRQRRRESIFGSLKGKLLIMGGISLAISVILGIVGIASLNKNNAYNQILETVNDVNVKQYENQSLESSYLYFLEDSYLEKLTVNLEEMQSKELSAKGLAGGVYDGAMESVAEITKKCQDNYSRLRTLSSERGFTAEDGKYAQFLSGDEELSRQFQAVMDDKSWLDGTWEDAVPDKPVTEGETVYDSYTYTTEVPREGKRDYFLIRLGGNHTSYQGKILVGDIVFSGKEGSRELAVTDAFQEIKQASYGDGLKGMEQERFQGADRIAVQAKFQDVDGSWQELTIKIPAADFNMQEYDRVSYELLFQPGNYEDLKSVCAFAQVYDFRKTLDKINSDFVTYSRHVMEGADTKQEMETLSGLLGDIENNLGIYVRDDTGQSELKTVLQTKKDAFEAMSKEDQEIFQVKMENKELFEELTRGIVQVRNDVEEKVAAEKRELTTLILTVLLLGLAVLLVGTAYISRTINGSMRRFKGTLEQVTDGNLMVRAEEKGRDEFAVFGAGLNSLLSRLEEVIGSVQRISGIVSRSGEQMETMANDSVISADRIEGAVGDIAKGASRQAEEIDSVTKQTAHMGEVFAQIMRSVENLDGISGQMQQVSRETVGFMGELADSNKKTTRAFEQVRSQIHATNESAEKIHEAADLIISIADQTNLLSLNASIEAARAGEAGKGFAVVASEIQQLSVQTNSSVDIIEKIIKELAEEAKDTMMTMEEVSDTIQSQMEKMQKTQERLEQLDDGIRDSGVEAEEIKQATLQCDKLRGKVSDSVESLVVISEKNAFSAEETNHSMSKLNQAVVQVSEAARELKEISEDLNGKLQFFHLS